MAVNATTGKYCVIGAGAAGITAAKNLMQMDIPVDVVEREDNVGGNWYYGRPNSSVYNSVRLISSKPFTQYTDYPIPDSWPTFLSHQQALTYLRSYARAFNVYDHIQFQRSVERVEPVEDGRRWKVVLDGGETRVYAGVVVANGHLWKPRQPEYPGTFNGVTIHSSRYKTPDLLRGKRVLVVGSGNSGCDIAVEASHEAGRTFHSTRRGYYFYPKYMFGLPADVVYEFTLKLHLPMFLRRFFGKLILRLNSAGTPEGYGLPRPDHKLFEEHILINSTLLYHLGQGDITPKPDIAELRGDRVRFTDGTEEPIDVIVYATGFHLTEFPFLDRQYFSWDKDHPGLYLNVFHPQYDNLFVVGLMQTNTGNWPLMDYQAQLVSRFIHAQSHAPRKAEAFRALKAGQRPSLTRGIRFRDSPRFAIEVEHYSYRATLKKLIARMNTRAARAAALQAVPSSEHDHHPGSVSSVSAG
jgi:cation diffusion facilitator CzcD-associated flavoprotein CzcO